MLRKLIRLLTPLLLSIPASAGLLTFNLDLTVIQSTPNGNFYPTGPCQNQDGDAFHCVIFTGEISTAADPAQDYFLDSLNIFMDLSNPDGGGGDVNDNTYNNALFGNAYFLNATAASGLLGPDNPGVTPFVYSGGIFEVDVAPGTPDGIYRGAAILSYTDATDCTDPANPCTTSVNFAVDIPEPAMFSLMAAGLAALAALRFRRKARA